MLRSAAAARTVGIVRYSTLAPRPDPRRVSRPLPPPTARGCLSSLPSRGGPHDTRAGRSRTARATGVRRRPPRRSAGAPWRRVQSDKRTARHSHGMQGWLVRGGKGVRRDCDGDIIMSTRRWVCSFLPPLFPPPSPNAPTLSCHDSWSHHAAGVPRVQECRAPSASGSPPTLEGVMAKSGRRRQPAGAGGAGNASGRALMRPLPPHSAPFTPLSPVCRAATPPNIGRSGRPTATAVARVAHAGGDVFGCHPPPMP